MSVDEARKARRNLPLLALPLAIAVLAAALWWLPLGYGLGLATLLAVAGAVVLRRPALRNAALVTASVLFGLTGFEIAFGLIDPGGYTHGVVKTSTPEHWTSVDSTIGYRPDPGVSVDVVAKYRDELVFHQTYTMEPSGERATPGSAAVGPTYLFIGDSFVFGEGLADSETLPSQFAQHLRPAAHVVNLGVLGYAPNHLVRAVESGLYDRYVVDKVAAVVTWIIPEQLPRVTGDGGWLTLSPRFVLDDKGGLRHTGTFLAHRLTNPLAGASYVARSRFAWVERAVGPALYKEQCDLYVALLARLRDLVRARYNAPLVLIYHWPDRYLDNAVDLAHLPTFKAIQALGMPMVSVRALIGPSEQWPSFFFAHDGHPNAHLAGEVARALQATLVASPDR